MTGENEQQMEIVSDVDMSQYRGRLINRDLVRDMAESLMAMHPGASDIGGKGMATVAQLALLTGANPLPGTNGIHAWRDKKGRLCVQFGIGYWRSKIEEAGGVFWVDRARPMSDAEREFYAVNNNMVASIASAALSTDVVQLMRSMRELGVEISLRDAKDELAQIGYGVVLESEYDKAGRNAQWTADLRAERDLYRKLVPALVQERRRAENGEFVRGGLGWRRDQYTGESVTVLSADYSADDANRDLFGDDIAQVEEGDFEEVEMDTGEIVDAIVGELEPEPEPAPQLEPTKVSSNGNGKLSDSTRRKLHAVGTKLYGDGWNSKRADMSAAFEVTSGNDWTEDQAQKVIDGMNRRLAEKFKSEMYGDNAAAEANAELFADGHA